tara:strand:- start:139 stop:1653 length:1515 start_codon:yes stop_codon:yes gene_type:complete
MDPVISAAVMGWFVSPVALSFYVHHQKKRMERLKTRLRAQEVEAKKAHATLSKEVVDLEGTLSEVVEDRDMLMGHLEEARASEAEVREALASMSNEVAGLEGALSESAEDRSALMEHVHDARKFIENATKRLKVHRQRNLDLHAELERSEFERSQMSLLLFDDDIMFPAFHVPSFDLETSDEFKAAIKGCKGRQKAMAANGTATATPTGFPKKLQERDAAAVRRQVKLTLRAFNNECDAVISAVKWNNLEMSVRKIQRSAVDIDKANLTTGVQIKNLYVDLKIEELHLVHQQREIAKAEKEERAEILRAEREEKKLLAEAAAAERAEAEARRALEKARIEAQANDQSDELKARIAELENSLATAEASTERARSMAELTKCGYVYIISNIGSFGEGIVKIGLTRRLDPNDRVKELGDASVPFLFDTHAMIYSEDAPTLENALHAEFNERRVNAANPRKEFFYATLDEVEEAVTRLAPDATFSKDLDAQEWAETMALRASTLEAAQ